MLIFMLYNGTITFINIKKMGSPDKVRGGA